MSDMRMEWWNDFRQRGVEDLRKQVLASSFDPDKHRAARRWPWWHDHGLKVATGVVALIAAAATVANLFGA
jgi:hypothetical protein